MLKRYELQKRDSLIDVIYEQPIENKKKTKN